jgi:type III secretory pathway lipoprotein EscJ
MHAIKYLIPASIASLIYNMVLLLSVTLNLEWTKTRAAGGQFESFPISLRILYFFMAVMMAAIAFWIWSHRNQTLNEPRKKFSKYLAIIFTVSTIFQLISRSPDERWNAIPALILAITFFTVSRN